MIVSCYIRNPKNTILFKSKNDRAECRRIDCSIPECPLRKNGQCAKISVLGFGSCPYGKIFYEKGPTQRARGMLAWIEKRTAENKGIPSLTYPTQKMAFIGDYVYLPYFHMDMNKTIPFLEHSNFFSRGTPFVGKEFWTIDAVLNIIAFRPQALMGGEITSYKDESIPLFLKHLREEDKEMWAKLIKVRPEFDVEPNYVGRKALLNTLNFPIEWTVKNEKYGYPVTWKWDGDVLTSDSTNIYSSTWGGGLKMKDFIFKGHPDDGTAIEVLDNAWVNDKTMFVN